MNHSPSNLPSNSPCPSPHPAESTAPAKTNGDSPTLLVVDDDPMIRLLEVEILRREGYQVLQADGPVEALRLAGITANIHLLVTDYSLPDGNGLELTRRFRDLHPAAPVLMVSGSVPVRILDHTTDLERFALLEKPFVIDDLIQKVRTLLDDISPFPLRKS